VSQLLTLYTTPVVYLYLDRLQAWLRDRRSHALTIKSSECLWPFRRRDAKVLNAAQWSRRQLCSGATMLFAQTGMHFMSAERDQTGRPADEVALPWILSALAGMLDGACLLGIGDINVAFLSGDTSEAGTALAQGHWKLSVVALGVIGAFVFGAAGDTALALQVSLRRPTLGTVSALSPALAAFTAIPATAPLSRTPGNRP
jgi:hypothetical protein